MKVERRDFNECEIGIETRADGKRYLRGYAAVFYDKSNPAGTEYQLSQRMKERILPSAFNRAIQQRQDTEARYNHDKNQLLGRVSTGTLELTVDERGLKYAVPIDDNDPDHVRVVAKVERGDLRGSSFAFIPTSVGESFAYENGIVIRNVTDVDLFDVGPVNKPAYQGTAVTVREMNEESLTATLQKIEQAEFAHLHRMHKLEMLDIK